MTVHRKNMSENEDTLAKGIEIRCRRNLGNTQVAKRDLNMLEYLSWVLSLAEGDKLGP
jgi:hypothetical protein